MSSPKSDFQAVLELVGHSLWPITVLAIVWMFKSELGILLKRVTSAKFGGSEVAFQPPSDVLSKKSEDLIASNLVVPQKDGFLGENEVRRLVYNSGIVAEDGETIFRAVKIFSTPSQETWIIITKSKFICILDNFASKDKNRPVQWIDLNGDRNNIYARQKNSSIGLLNINDRKNWLYSTYLWPDPQGLQTELSEAARLARAIK